VQLRHGIGSLKEAQAADAKATKGVEIASLLMSFIPYGGGAASWLLEVGYEHGISDMVKTMASNGYSREAEFAADQAALVILREAGYSEAALASMLRNMSGRLVAGAGFGKTHPPPADRLNALGSSGNTPANPVRQARYQAALADVISGRASQ